MHKNQSNYKILKKSEKKELIEKLSYFYECDLNFLYSYSFYITESKGKVYISSANLETLELERISGIGLYFGTMHDNDRFRLSIEGSNFITPNKNFVKINKENLKSYLAGESLFKDEVIEINWEKQSPFLIVRFENQSLGCMNLKDKELLSYMPKSRRLNFNKLF